MYSANKAGEEAKKARAAAKEARVEAENKGAAEESIAKNTREEAKKAANNRTNTAHTSNRAFGKTYKLLLKHIYRLQKKAKTLRNLFMIKDNEAKIKAYKEEIRKLQIREKKMANNTRKKNRR